MTRSQPSRRAPGPRGVALWHSLRRMQQSPLREYQALREQFGDVVRLATLPHPVYLVSHPDAVQYILRENARNYRKGRLFKPIAALQGQGLLTSEGDLWARQRRLMQPAFQQRQLATCATVMVHEARAVVQEWRHLIQTGTPVNVAARMQRLTFNVVGRVLLGADPGALEAYSGTLQAIAMPLLHYINARATRIRGRPHSGSPHRATGSFDAPWPSTMPWCSRSSRHVVKPGSAERARRRMCSRCCWQRARTRPAPASASGSSVMRSSRSLALGPRPSAHALSWTWYLLAHHPEVAHHVQTELDTVLGGRPPTPQDLRHLPYSRMVLDETLRLYPPSVVLPRQANAPDEISGYAIPQDAVVVISQYVTHRHPDFWSEPEQFQPERFTPEQEPVGTGVPTFPLVKGRGCVLAKRSPSWKCTSSWRP